MVSHLTDIPEELIDNICQFLATKDVSRFRLTCTIIRNKSYHAWATSSFQQMEFMITRNSLQHLIYFSKHKKFGPCIRELRIHTVSISALSKDEFIAWNEERGAIKRSGRRAYNRLSHDQNRLRKRSIDVSMLVEAMRNLPNLKVIKVYGNSDVSRVWGVKQIRKMTGIYPPSAPDLRQMRHWWTTGTVDKMNAHVFATVLSAIATSGVKLRGLYIRPPVALPSRLPVTPNGRSRSFTPRQTLSEAHIGLLKPAFSQLKELHLTAASWKDDPGKLMWITRLLSLCPDLEVFRLTAPHDSAQFISRISRFQLFPKIRVLRFSRIIFSPSHLISLLTNHASTLERFHLHKSTMKDSTMEEGSYTHILRALQSLPRLNFVDFSTNFITGWYKAEELYVWYSANGLEVTNLILGAENGKKMAEELGMVITRQLETGAA
ncbi:uncharacterized protein K441DRAFT_674824 [Cenococcum geophilum 1.58]|uniref:uncharacterized protein n=1 Tax=Cenococcum geophilum 1.58 TaxID=794803 RepID=UPI00358E6E5D|nr:hypothetical protein K441DRAFT_674824 [Cenococcum geophilum 1.58]